MRGFALVEALLTLFLVSLIFGCLAGLVGGYSRATSFSARQENGSWGAEAALDSVRSDLEAAVSVTSLSPLKLTRVDPVGALTGVNRVAPSANWNPHGSSFLLTITYELAGGALTRRVQSSSQDVRQLLARDVQGLAVVDRGQGLYSVTASFFGEQSRLYSERTSVLRRVEPWP